MLKDGRILLVLFVLGFYSCGIVHTNWNYHYPYCKINPSQFKKNLPVNYDDCLIQFDDILSNEIINHFQALDSAIAPIEISQAIGGVFINFWNLAYYRNREVETINHGYSYKPPVLDRFIKDGINDPEAMIRILFKCYHKKRNNTPYSWEDEIHLLNSYWIPYKRGEGWVSKEMKERENELLTDYHFQQLAINDTVDVLYNRAPRLKIFRKDSDWYYLTGIIQFKLPETKFINVKLIEIQSEFKDNFMKTDDNTIVIGDTLTDYCKGWLRRGTYYMNYQKNKEFRD